MKLLRYGPPGKEMPALLDRDGHIRSLQGVVDDIAAKALSRESLRKLQELDIDSLPIVNTPVRIGPCVGGIGKFICIGLNYAEHAAETGVRVPAEPVVFMKATSAIVGPNDDLHIPRGAKKN